VLPELSPEDAASYLQLEAEKGFPCDPEQLQIARSVQKTAGGSYVTQLAVRKEQLERLAAVLRAAGLKPLSFSLGFGVLPGVVPAAGRPGRITVALDARGAALLLAAGGGIAALRTSEATIESEAGERLVNHGAVVRELRITYEQVPADLRKELRQVRLCGDEVMVRQLGENLAGWTAAAGLELERDGTPEGRLADEMAAQLAARWLEHGAQELEFLPPRPGRWAVLMARYNARRVATAGFAVGAAALLTVAAFGWLEYRRWSLRAEWQKMEAQVTALETTQARLREFTPYYDTTCQCLNILRLVTEAFPETGTVTAKTFEIRGAATVNVTGTTRDTKALLLTQDKLRKMPEVDGLKLEQIRGKTPAQFTLSFRWTGATEK
jgi:hypothetical protein